MSVSVLQAVDLVWGLVAFDFDAYLEESVHAFERNGRELQITTEFALATWFVGFGLAALVIGLRAGLAFALRRGYNWIRIVLTVLFGAVLLPPYTASTITDIAFTVFVIVLTAAGIVLIWQRQSNTFFRDVKQDRIAYKAKQFS
ncbi:hypothetical protein [Agromyces sp. PvR057]|uniref:hypothetical protein n=1 Tax=Agromyces sp. PvR057 TaxID=3156403 RepID=UPI003395EE72